MASYNSILYLDDQRIPRLPGINVVHSYAEFVQHLEERGVPDLISFDHDLAREHYPAGPNLAGQQIPYAAFRQKTGLDCARYVIENDLPLKHWAVHSQNVQGKINLERELRRFCSRGEVRDIHIPFDLPDIPDIPQPEELEPRHTRSFSATSLLQFQEDLPLEGWEKALAQKVARRGQDHRTLL